MRSRKEKKTRSTRSCAVPREPSNRAVSLSCRPPASCVARLNWNLRFTALGCSPRSGCTGSRRRVSHGHASRRVASSIARRSDTSPLILPLSGCASSGLRRCRLLISGRRLRLASSGNAVFKRHHRRDDFRRRPRGRPCRVGCESLARSPARREPTPIVVLRAE